MGASFATQQAVEERALALVLEVLDFSAELVEFPLLVLEEVGNLVQLRDQADEGRLLFLQIIHVQELVEVLDHGPLIQNVLHQAQTIIAEAGGI